jgi:uncharacterized membrane protein
MHRQIKASTPIGLALTAVSTSLVCVATIVFSFYVPQTRGFFNIGETMVFTTAILFGPVIGAFAGGVGSMLADILLGYPYYAPATLIIKATEGAIVGFLSRKKPNFSRKSWKAFTFLIGLIIGISLSTIGSVYYTGEVELALGIPQLVTLNAVFSISPVFWYVIGAFIVLLVTLMGLIFEPELGWLVFATLLGGATMVTGYFIYQQFLLFPLFNIAVIAFAEIPVNIGQMLVGLVVAIPIVKIVMRSVPQLKS